MMADPRPVDYDPFEATEQPALTLTDPSTGLPKPDTTKVATPPASAKLTAVDYDPFGEEEPIAKPKPTILGELGKGVAQGTLGFGEMAGGIAALTGAEETGKKLISGAQELSKPYSAAVGSWEDIDSARDALLYAAHGLGTVIPTMALSIASGGAGALATGGKVG